MALERCINNVFYKVDGSGASPEMEGTEDGEKGRVY